MIAGNSNIFRFAVFALLFGLCSPIQAQQKGKIFRIGFLDASTASGSAVLVDAFRQELSKLGWIEGKNTTIEYRFAEQKIERLPELAVELVLLKVDLIVVPGVLPALAAKKATPTVPIVVANAPDPVGAGLVVSLARPGGTFTGLTRLSNSPETTGKRLEVLKETFPEVKVVAVLRNPDSAYASPVFKEMQAVGQTLGFQLQSVEIRSPNDFDNAFSAIRKNRADALMVLSGPNTITGEPEIVKFAITSRLPTMYFRPEAVDRGGLMYYGANESSLFFRAATYVDRILKGAKPADLPVEQPTKFELVINLKTAKQLGLAIPPHVLARADRVIK